MLCSRRLLTFTRIAAIHQLSASTNIAFIGLGNMGGPMALNLVKNGHHVHVFDKYESQVQRLLKLVTDDISGRLFAVDSLQNLMEHQRPAIVITMLPSSPQVREIYGDQSVSNGLINMAQENTVFIDCTTGDPQVAQILAQYAKSRNCVYLDAPVSGGVPAAQQGTLTFMVGGSKDAVDCVTPMLKTMGTRVFHCGSVGTGLAAKICNNMLLAVSMIGTSEAMELGKRLGLDPRVLADVINSSSGRCWSSEMYNPVPGIVPNVPSSREYTGGFVTALMAKDLGLAQNSSTATLCPTPMGSLAHQIYRSLCQLGYANKDFSCVYEFIKS